ncbi:MAG: MaoC family dehydratase [Candidatus Odyssella sp.]|nr:MaoC family dehydratase [Candidatus Odyssella sp.]
MTAVSLPLVVAVAELPKHVGETLGPSPWITVDQAMIDKFAEATGDHQWIHVDPARAARELPGGKTIAHGYLTLSLLPRLMRSVVEVRFRQALNYGSNKVRYTGMVPSGSRICLYQTLKAVDPEKNNGFRLTSECKIMVEGTERPALIAEVMAIFYP